MSMQTLRHIKQFIISLLVPALLFAGYGNVVNKHYHITESGSIVAHSHPFAAENNSPFQHHKHTKGEYAFLGLLSTLQQLLPVLLAVNFALVLYFVRKYFISRQANYKQLWAEIKNSRAPPPSSMLNINIL